MFALCLIRLAKPQGSVHENASNFDCIHVFLHVWHPYINQNSRLCNRLVCPVFFSRILKFRGNKQKILITFTFANRMYIFIYSSTTEILHLSSEIFYSPLWRQFLRLDRHTCRNYNFISAQYPSFFNIVSLFLSTIFV